MFFRKSKEIKELKSLLSIFYERNKIQTNLIRVHLNTNQRLRKELEELKKKGANNERTLTANTGLYQSRSV